MISVGPKPRRGLQGLAAFAVLAALTGCAPTPPSAPAMTVSPSAAPSEPAASAEPDEPSAATLPHVPGTEVVIVSVRATAPNGAAMDLTMTAYYPHAVGTPEAQQITDYLGEHPDASWIGGLTPATLADPTATLQVIDLEAVDVSPAGVTWPSTSSVWLALGPDLGQVVEGVPLDAAQLAGPGFPWLNGPGEGAAIAYLPGGEGAAAPAPENWASYWTFYGFRGVDFDAVASFSGCIVDVTELGRGSAGVEHWENNWDFGGWDCMVGIGH